MMNASTAVHTLAGHLGAACSGQLQADQASVVFLWPDGQKAYLTFKFDDDRLYIEQVQCSDREIETIITEQLTKYYQHLAVQR